MPSETTADEMCAYCGHRGDDVCDAPPPDVCERAVVQTTVPPLTSLRDWHVGATDNGMSEVRIVLADPAEAKAWLAWMFDRQGAEFDV